MSTDPKPEWYKDSPTMWCHPEWPIAVSKEEDGLWHGIVTDLDDATTTVGFKAITDAFNDAEGRYKP